MMESEDDDTKEKRREFLRNLILAKEQERRDQDDRIFRDMEKHARCALLPSPEMLNNGFSLGSDSTGTLKDFETVLKWATEAGLTMFSYSEVTNDKDVYHGTYYSMIVSAFSMAFAALCHTANPELNEVVLWYYAGHGLGKNDASTLSYSASPELKKVQLMADFNQAPSYLMETKKVKGGELCLHKVGFCDLRGLLAPFIHAIRCESQNSKSKKKNKHLLIILDSCYSGELARDLDILMAEQPSLKKELEDDGCSITVQASCGADEPTQGGYFTPTFVFMNKPEKRGLLNYMKETWNNLKQETKDKYRALQLPSPVVTSTKPIDNSQPTLEIDIQNLQITLFNDFGFFKFCHHEMFSEEEFLGFDRAMNCSLAGEFLRKKIFNVIDYKLKVFEVGSCAKKPFGLFLLEDPCDAQLAVCAHVQFPNNDTSRVGRIELVHHKKSMSLNLLDFELEYAGELSNTQIKKIPVAQVPSFINPDQNDPSQWIHWEWKKNPNEEFSDLAKRELSNAAGNVDQDKIEEVKCAMELITECHEFVIKNGNEWDDLSKWNMDNSFAGKSRMIERSLYMTTYLEDIKAYDLLTV